MIGRLIAFVTLGLIASVALSASAGGGSAASARDRDTPARYQQRLEDALVAERSRAQEAERDWRYQTGQMGPAERADYQAEQEEKRRAAAAAALAAARLRELQRRQSGGGYSSGK